MADTAACTADALLATIRAYESCAVAFSAGVDSAVVAKAAQLALEDRAVAVTGVGPALAEGELAQAEQVARQIGIRHEVTPTEEISVAAYVANGPDRCFHCKTELYGHVERVAQQLGLQTIANGANTDDQSDYRPGMQAAQNFSVRSPLVEAGLNKAAVRLLARYWDLPVWNKPAAPCLASRVAYGVSVTPERLRKIDLAEQYVRSLGIPELRVRCLAGEVASVEVPREAIARFENPELKQLLVQHLHGLGFAEVKIDPDGFRSGSLNEVLPIELLSQPQKVL